MCKNKKKSNFKCKECEFYNKETKTCEIKDIKSLSKKEIKECKDFLVRDELVYY